MKLFQLIFSLAALMVAATIVKADLCTTYDPNPADTWTHLTTIGYPDGPVLGKPYDATADVNSQKVRFTTIATASSMIIKSKAVNPDESQKWGQFQFVFTFQDRLYKQYWLQSDSSCQVESDYLLLKRLIKVDISQRK